MTKKNLSFSVRSVSSVVNSTPLRPQRGRTAYPFQIAIVIDAHHHATSHAHQRQHGRKVAALGPNKHHANFHLRRTVRCLNHRLELHPLLENVVVRSEEHTSEL